LTLLGYSINDTIVIFDRIRENSHDKPEMAMAPIINSSIIQTLGRTMNTSFATLISVVAIIIGGAVELYDFAYVLIFGVVVGTYSSIFIAAPTMEIFDNFMRNRRSKQA
jgi:preprotein translocase subunit SecF